MSDGAAPALEVQDISVQYGEATALRQVSVAFAPACIHAVVGQNGAGKTTLARVAAGIVRPVSGALRVTGREVSAGNVAAARAAGVELVHQSFALPPSFTVAEAMEFGSTRHRGKPYTRAELESRWRPHLEGLGLLVSPGARVRELPVEAQQGVEIARALVTEARVLILDEPTALLPPTGIATLFRRLDGLRQAGVTIILILHKIREVLEVADTVTVLRSGRHVEGPVGTRGIDVDHLAAAIIGSAPPEALGDDQAALVGARDAPAHATPAAEVRNTPAVLAMEGVFTRPDTEGRPLEQVTLAVRAGEIVGVAGVEGNGQHTLVRACAGLAGMEAGRIMLAGADVTHSPPSTRRASGLRIIPFERNTEGLSLSSTLWENWAVRKILLAGHVLAPISPARLRAQCEASLRRWDVRFAATEQRAGALSGGNAQKLILAREIEDAATVLIAAQPTRGLDIGATAFVWSSLRQVRARGCGVLLISSDLDELFDISDRIVVMLAGRIVGEFAPPYRLEAIARVMTGVAQ